jgi:hypothetical protein
MTASGVAIIVKKWREMQLSLDKDKFVSYNKFGKELMNL